MAFEYPWFPFYAGDWLADINVQAMDLAQRGAYITLLCYQWREGAIPDDPEALKEALGLTNVPGFETHIWPKLLLRFALYDDGKRRNPKLHQLRADRIGLSEIRAIAGRKGGKVNKQNASKDPSKNKQDDSDSSSSLSSSSSSPEGGCKGGGFIWEHQLARWNNEIAGLLGARKIRSMNPARRRKLQARLDEVPDMWDQIEKEAPQLGSWAREKSFISFDWILLPTNLAKFLEGNYREKTAGGMSDEELRKIVKEARGE